MKKSRVKTRLPAVFPCGCVAIYRNPKSKSRTFGSGLSLTMKDGSKICKCGRRWSIAWVEIPR